MAGKKTTKAKKQRRGFFGSIKKFFRDSKAEFKKVVWPSKKQLINNTTIVIIAMIISGIFVGALDAVLAQIVKFALKA